MLSWGRVTSCHEASLESIEKKVISLIKTLIHVFKIELTPQGSEVGFPPTRPSVMMMMMMFPDGGATWSCAAARRVRVRGPCARTAAY